MKKLGIVGMLATWFLPACGTLVTAPRKCETLGPYSGTRASAQGPHTFLDVPFSFVMDTVLSPFTLSKAAVEAVAQPEPPPGCPRREG